MSERVRLTGDTVTVGCRLPNGLILQLSELVDMNEAVQGGFRAVKQPRRLPEQYPLRGTAVDVDRIKRDGGMPYLIVDGAAFTPGIPREFWERWLDIYKDSEFVKNGLVFAHSDDASLRSMARERAGQRSGLEPIDPNNPQAHVPGIQLGERT